MVVTADDRGYIHAGIIDNNDEVVGRRAVGSLDDQVIELFVIKGDRPLDQIIEGSDTILRRLEADDVRLVRDSQLSDCGRCRHTSACAPRSRAFSRFASSSSAVQ